MSAAIAVEGVTSARTKVVNLVVPFLSFGDKRLKIELIALCKVENFFLKINFMKSNFVFFCLFFLEGAIEDILALK